MLVFRKFGWCKKWMILNQRFSDASRGIERNQWHKIGLVENFDTTFFWLVCNFKKRITIHRAKLLGNCFHWFLRKYFVRNHFNQQCDWYDARKKPIWLLEKAIYYFRMKNTSSQAFDRTLNTPLLISLVHKLTLLFPMHPFSAPWNRKLWGFLTFSGGREKVHWE